MDQRRLYILVENTKWVKFLSLKKIARPANMILQLIL